MTNIPMTVPNQARITNQMRSHVPIEDSLDMNRYINAQVNGFRK
jgi:hypothetical protein